MSSKNSIRDLFESEEFAYPCYGTWKGDSDIAGIGVLLGFVIYAYTTLLVSIIVACFETVEWWKDSHNEGRWRWLATTSTLANRPIGSIHKLHLICSHLQGTLCDVQIVTGAGIVIAAFMQWDTIPFYHEQIAISCWWLTISSLFAARGSSTTTAQFEASSQNATNGHRLHRSGSRLRSGYKAMEEEEDIVARWEFGQAWIRDFGIFASLTLSATFQAMIIAKEEQYWDEDWNEDPPGRCYLTHARDQSDWLWCVGTALFAVFMLLEISSPGSNGVDNAISEIHERILKILCDATADYWKSLCSTQNWWSYALNALTVVALGTATFLVWVVLQFISLWVYGGGFYPVEVMFQVGYAVYTIWYMFDLRSSNEELVTSSENTWGFVQVLPVALLATIFISYVDAHAEVVKGMRHIKLVRMGGQELALRN
ncbi:hypothetical protein PG991_008188 [Apiospora marii]|uniref:Uncharacterized protein n=1 Tax=Apiospora marii TaxID=335849 RepID=A0ABR1RVK8_9PEZI